MVVKAADTAESAQAGMKVGAFLVGPTNKWMARAPKGMPATGLLTLTNVSAQPTRVTGIETNGRIVSAQLNTLEEGKRYSINFASSAELPIGIHKDILKVRTDSKETPEMAILLEVTVYPAVLASPNKLEFDLTSVGDVDEELSGISKFLWLRLGRGMGLDVTSITSDLPFIQGKINSKDGQTIVVRVGFSKKPPAGQHSGILTVVTNVDAAKTIEIPISINVK